ncbi:TPA: hypothetical protein ACSP2Y_002304 [Aeromonas veronii]
MRNLLCITLIMFPSFLLANGHNNPPLRLYERNTPISNILVEYFQDSSKKKLKSCSVSKSTESGFLSIVFSDDKGIGVFTNSRDSSQLFCNEKNVHIKSLQISDNSTLLNNKAHPLSNTVNCDSRYTASYFCDKNQLKECITPYTNKKIMLTSGVKTKIIDSLDKALDSDAILTFSNCIDNITKKDS